MRQVFRKELAKQALTLRELIGEPDWSHFTLYMLDDVAALWFSKWFDGAEVGLWICEGFRHSPSIVYQIDFTFREALKKYPVVISFTQQAGVIKLLRHLGFSFSAHIPEARNGQPVTMYYTTPLTYRGLSYGSKL